MYEIVDTVDVSLRFGPLYAQMAFWRAAKLNVAPDARLIAKSRCRCRWTTPSPTRCAMAQLSRGSACDCALSQRETDWRGHGDRGQAPTDFEAKYLEAVLDEEPLLSEHLLDWPSGLPAYYLAPLGEVLRGMLPLIAEVRRTVYYRITDLGRDVLARQHEGDGGRESVPRARATRKRPSKALNSPKDRIWSGAFWSGWLLASR